MCGDCVKDSMSHAVYRRYYFTVYLFVIRVTDGVRILYKGAYCQLLSTYGTIMNSAGIHLLLGITIAIAAPSMQEGTCNACNCQFNNVQVLTQLIREEISSIVGNFSADGQLVSFTACCVNIRMVM